MGTLFIVATPIGNLKDITLRAIEILTQVDFVACEDTRHTGNLLSIISEIVILNSFQDLPHTKPDEMLKPFGLALQSEPSELTQVGQVGHDSVKKPKLLSYYEQNETYRIPEIISILLSGNDVALVSDAGTPTISDPGFKLVRECIAQGIKVESIPGASSVLTALTVSGLPTDKFLSLGFLPKKEGHRKTLLENAKSLSIASTIIILESPYRITKTLGELQEVLGDINVVVCRELTKLHEEVRRERISESLEHFKKVNPKGEFVILFHL